MAGGVGVLALAPWWPAIGVVGVGLCVVVPGVSVVCVFVGGVGFCFLLV